MDQKVTTITDAALAELDEMHLWRNESEKAAWRWAKSSGICYPSLRQRLADAEARLAEAEELSASLQNAAGIAALEAELAEARKDGERLSALQDGRLSTQYRDGATPSMDKWIVTFCATPIAGGSTLRAAIDNATSARGTR